MSLEPELPAAITVCCVYCVGKVWCAWAAIWVGNRTQGASGPSGFAVNSWLRTAVPGKDGAAKVVQVHLDELGHIAGGHRLRHRGEAADVDEHQRDVATLAAAEDVIHAPSGLGELRNNLGLQVLAEQSCDLALLAVLIEEPVCSHAGICEDDPKPRVEEVWHPVVEGRER